MNWQQERAERMKTTEVKSFADVDTSELNQPIICVFNRTDDYPDKCVARVCEGTAPTNIIITKYPPFVNTF